MINKVKVLLTLFYTKEYFSIFQDTLGENYINIYIDKIRHIFYIKNSIEYKIVRIDNKIHYWTTNVRKY